MVIRQARVLRSIISTLMLVAAFCIGSAANADGIFEAGTVGSINGGAGGGFTSVNFQQTYSSTPVVFLLSTNAGGDPAAIRINNVTTSGFDAVVAEPPNEDGPHANMTGVSYLAIMPGRYTLPNGSVMEVGRHDTTTVVSSSGGGHDSIAFSSAFPSSPVVLADIQSLVNETNTLPNANSDPWLTVSIDNNGTSGTPSITTTGFDVALEKAETGSGNVASAETIGYLAFTAGHGNIATMGDFLVSGGTVEFDASISDDVIEGWDQPDSGGAGSGNAVTFGSPFAAAPDIVIASMATRDGADGGWLRANLGSITAAGLKLATDEDQTSDTERNHTPERASIVAFANAFTASSATNQDVHFDDGSTDTSGPVDGSVGNNLWGNNINWRVNSTPGQQNIAPNNVLPGITDRVNISLNDGENLDQPALIATGDSFEVSSVRIGGNFGLGTGGDGILNVDGGELTVSGTGLGSGIQLGFANRDGKLNISNGGLVDITSGDLVVGIENGNAGDVSEVNVTGASTLNVAGSFHIAGNQNTNADANTRGTVVIGNGADSPTVNVNGGNTEVARGGIGRLTLNSGEFNQNASNFVLAQTRNTGSTSNTNAIVDVNGGTLNIAGSGALNMNGGVSVFNHNGGDVNVGGDMQMATANDSTSNATYNLDAGAGTLSIGGDLFVGRDRVAEFNYESGGFNIGGTIYVGGFDNTSANNRPNADGTINIGVSGGNPTMNTNQFEVGRHNLGLVNQDNGTVNVNNGNLVLGQLSNADGTYDISGGTLNIANNLNNNSGDATLNISGAGIVNVGGDINLSNANSGGATVNVSGGEFNIEGNFGYRSNGSDVVNQSGGNVTIEGSLNMAGTGTQDYNLSGGVLSFADTAMNTQQPNPTDSNNSSSININSAGDFSFTGGQLENVSDINAGNGPFTQDGGRFVIGVDGVDPNNANTIRAMTTIDGDYNQNDGTLVVDIFGPGSHGGSGEDGGVLTIDPLSADLDSDILQVTGNAFLDGTLEVNLNGYEPAAFHWYDVLLAEGGILDADDLTLTGVNFFRVIDNPNDPTGVSQLLQVAVPEPASIALWSLIGLGLAGFAYVRRRR